MGASVPILESGDRVGDLEVNQDLRFPPAEEGTATTIVFSVLYDDIGRNGGEVTLEGWSSPRPSSRRSSTATSR